jgi:hypothetical protein
MLIPTNSADNQLIQDVRIVLTLHQTDELPVLTTVQSRHTPIVVECLFDIMPKSH